MYQAGQAVIGLAGAGHGGGDVARGNDQRRRGIIDNIVLGRVQAVDLVGAGIHPVGVAQRTVNVGVAKRRRVDERDGVIHLVGATAGDGDRRQETPQQRHRVAFIHAPYRRTAVKSKPLKLACCCICSAVRPTAPALSLVAPVVWKKLPVTAPPLAPAPTSALTTSVQLDLTAPLLYVAFKVPYIPL